MLSLSILTTFVATYPMVMPHYMWISAQVLHACAWLIMSLNALEASKCLILRYIYHISDRKAYLISAWIGLISKYFFLARAHSNFSSSSMRDNDLWTPQILANIFIITLLTLLPLSSSTTNFHSHHDLPCRLSSGQIYTYTTFRFLMWLSVYLLTSSLRVLHLIILSLVTSGKRNSIFE